MISKIISLSFFIACLFFNIIHVKGQSENVGIGTLTPDQSAILDMVSSEKGVLVPRMTTVQRSAITTPANGLLVYDTVTSSFWFFNGSSWVNLSSSSNTLTDTDGDTKIYVQKFGDEDIIRFDLEGSEKMVLNKNEYGDARLEIRNSNSNTFIGDDSGVENNLGYANTSLGILTLNKNTSGYFNTASGFGALRNNISGESNTANGSEALLSNIMGNGNTAMGAQALYFNTGSNNTATGYGALRSNTNANFNTANGYLSLYSNTTGSSNTANGCGALQNNLTGTSNTAIGHNSLLFNSIGNFNIAVGNNALLVNASGNNNISSGLNSLLNNISGNSNIAHGVFALFRNTTRSYLVAVGDSSLYNNGLGASSPDHATRNTAIGSKSLFGNTIGYNNTASGFRALYSNSTGNNNTANGASALALNTIAGNNTAIGSNALTQNVEGNENSALGSLALYSNLTGNRNLASGFEALFSNLYGNGNTALGIQTLFFNLTGNNNTAIGNYALIGNSTGSANVGVGVAALLSNSSRSYLVAIGDSSLYNNGLGASTAIHATRNTAIGSKSLFGNTIGYNNTASGSQALYSNVIGFNNSAVGADALYSNTEGSRNSSFGYQTLYTNTSGSYNTASGNFALYHQTSGDYNTAFGYRALDNNNTGSHNTGIGHDADVSAVGLNYATALGAGSKVNCSNCLVLGGTGVSAVKVGIGVNAPSSTLELRSSATGGDDGIEIVSTSGTNRWNINWNSNNLGFYYNGASRGFLSHTVDAGEIDFTAQHRNLPKSGTVEDFKDKIGMIVSSAGTISNLNGSTMPSINESLPHVQLSTKAYDKSIYGVIASVEDPNDENESKSSRIYKQGLFSTSLDRADENDYRLIVNSGGEGAVWVSNFNGNIENGDLIVTSPIPGIGMKQDDGFIQNHTVAKIVMDCDFDIHSDKYICKEIMHDGQKYKMALLACVYKCN